MSWNYRVTRDRDGMLGVAEVYYDKQGAPIAYTRHVPIEGMDMEELASISEMMHAATEKPVLDEKSLPGKGSKKAHPYAKVIKFVLRNTHPRKLEGQPFWAWTSMLLGIKSNQASELCESLGFDPETGEESV